MKVVSHLYSRNRNDSANLMGSWLIIHWRINISSTKKMAKAIIIATINVIRKASQNFNDVEKLTSTSIFSLEPINDTQIK